MLKFIKSFLGHGSSRTVEATLVKNPPTQDARNIGIEVYFRNEVFSSKFIKADARDTVINHLLGNTNILKTENKLSSDEKKALGINARLSITRELVGVLTEEGIKTYHPSAIISEMWNRATIKKLRHDNIEKLRVNSYAKKFTLMSCGNGDDCKWCKANQNREFQVSVDIEALIDKNCTCDPYCKCAIQPVIEL